MLASPADILRHIEALAQRGGGARRQNSHDREHVRTVSTDVTQSPAVHRQDLLAGKLLTKEAKMQ